MLSKTENLPTQTTEVDNSYLKTVAQRTYNQTEKQSVDELVVRFIPLVHKIAKRISSYLRGPLDYDDMVSAGTVGLLKAANDFNPGFQNEFITYAFIKIKGAMLDELRSWSFVPAAVEKKIQLADKESIEFLEQSGRLPTDEELADRLDISTKKLSSIYEGARAKNFVSMDQGSENGFSFADLLGDSTAQSPSGMMEKEELLESLAEAIAELDEKPRNIIILYYQQGLTMRQIAEVMNITEPRVSQIHAGAVFKLSLKLKKWKQNE